VAERIPEAALTVARPVGVVVVLDRRSQHRATGDRALDHRVAVSHEQLD
jgi:hypothetical protein